MEKTIIPDYIELHDMRIEKINITNNGKGTLDIKHLPIYVKVQNNKYDIWSYSAKIEFDDIRLLKIDGLLSDWVVDGNIFNREGKNVELSIDNYCNDACKISVVFNNNSYLEIQASRINLILIDAIKKVEEWIEEDK